MEDGLLSLKWNNHKSTFFHILSSLRKKETYTDATIACEGQFFPVHKLVMSTCSDYFSEIFERTNCKSPVVILKDIKHHDLEALLDYMYLGEVDVKQSELAGLIKAAECLRIKGLAVPDEDPTLSQRKAPHVPEHRSSPAAKRLRKESGSCIDNSSHHHHYTNKNHKSLSPSRSHSSSSLTSTSVPSQSVNADTLSQVPSLSMLPPSYSDTRHIDLSSSTVTDSQKHVDQSSLVPVDMIKVEVEDEGNNNNSQLRQSQEVPDHRGGREESRVTEGGGEDSIEAGHRDKEALSNNFSENSGGNPADIEKEEHDQLDYFNGSDQIPGPSGVQGGSQIMNWSEEEGNFPHNLFGSDDSSHQQVGRNIASALNVNKLKSRINKRSLKHVLHPRHFVAVNNIEQNPDEESFEGFEPDNADLSRTIKVEPTHAPRKVKQELIEESFEGFEIDNDNLSEVKKNLIYKNWTEFVNGKSPENEEEEPTFEDTEGAQEYTPFEVLAQELEEELELLPVECCFEEKDMVYIPPKGKPRKFICYDCNNIFKTKKNLAEHLSERKFCSLSCPVCPYKGNDILDHIRFHADCSSDRKFHCLICKICVLTVEDFLNHLKSDHSY